MTDRRQDYWTKWLGTRENVSLLSKDILMKTNGFLYWQPQKLFAQTICDTHNNKAIKTDL